MEGGTEGRRDGGEEGGGEEGGGEREICGLAIVSVRWSL
jgi:hypothetical protein